MRSIALRPAAAADVDDAYLWYESQRPGLGEEFLDALSTAFDQILREPAAYPIVHRHTRRYLLRRFPYGLFYRLDGDRVLIVACMHASRHPGHWRARS